MARILLVTLSHNRGPLIRNTIKSVLAQTLPLNKFDYLIFDNNSTDNAKKIIKIVENKYGNISAYFSAINLGQQAAYNKILNEIAPKHFPKSEVMCILDDDDEIYPHALSEVDKMFSDHPGIGASYSGFSIIDGQGFTKVADHGKAKMVPKQFSKKGQLALRRRFIASNPCGHFRSYRISALKDVGGFSTDREFATDYCIFGSIMEKYPVVKIDSILYKFRQHGFGQVESKHSPQQTTDWKHYQAYFLNRWSGMGLI